MNALRHQPGSPPARPASPRLDPGIPPRPARRRGFTLIELLTVIGIIAILAALLIGSATYASRTVKERRVRAELSRLVTAIESYKAHFGFYPPDNPARPDQPALFYELVGTYLHPMAKDFRTRDDQEIIAPADVSGFFGVEGFANTALTANDVKSFLPELKPSQYAEISSTPDVEVLTVPVEGPSGRTNTWRYVSTRPTNNPGRFDLWAEILIGDRTNIIGNWK